MRGDDLRGLGLRVESLGVSGCLDGDACRERPGEAHHVPAVINSGISFISFISFISLISLISLISASD